jgi:hypothetical protein
MTNWIKLHKDDNYIDIIKGELGTPNSLEWAGEDQFYAWLDIDTTNWIAVYADATQDVINEGGGTVRAYVHLAASETPLTFGRRFRTHFSDDRASLTFDGANFAMALEAVTAEVRRAFDLPI